MIDLNMFVIADEILENSLRKPNWKGIDNTACVSNL